MRKAVRGRIHDKDVCDISQELIDLGMNVRHVNNAIGVG